MILVSSTRRLRPSATIAADIALDGPVVRVRAKFGQTWGAPGTGFFIQEWPSCVVTARHVVSIANETAPSEILVRGLAAGRWTQLEAAVVGFLKGGPAAEDVAIVRLNARVASPLRIAQLEGQEPAQIWGYPIGDEAPRPPVVVSTRARFVGGKVMLEQRGRVGMSGGPVVAVPAEGSPIAVVGVYLGPAANVGGRAHFVAGESVFVCKDAVMSCP